MKGVHIVNAYTTKNNHIFNKINNMLSKKWNAYSKYT